MDKRARSSRYLVGVLGLALLAGSAAQAEDFDAAHPTLRSSVNLAVRDAKRAAGEVGVHVVDARTGAEAYAFRADIPHILASNTKLVTSAAALDRLGPGYAFETEVLVTGQLTGDGVLEGDLAVVGGGDPTISGRHYFGDAYGAFREWASALEVRGIRRIAGDLVLVHGLFDDQRVHPDWPREQLDRWYEAPVEALSFNDNCLLIKVAPGDGVGAPARVETVPELAGFRVRSSAKTAARVRTPLRIGRSVPIAVFDVRGEISRRQRSSTDKWVTVPDPVTFFGQAMRAALAQEGIEVDGELRPVERLPGSGWSPVVTHRTDLVTVLEIVTKRSQNFYAEAVLKTLGARMCGDGSWRGGVRAVSEFLRELGLENGSYRLADGSGMSRNNRFTPRQLTHLLVSMHDHRWGEVFMRTLPVSGERDLSWSKRLASPPYRGNVLAKTGSLRAVSTLSGYAKGRSGRLYAFSILFNRAGARGTSRAAQDRIIRALIDHG